MSWIPWIAVVLVAVALVFIGLSVYGASRWSARTRALNEGLDAARQPIAPPAP